MKGIIKYSGGDEIIRKILEVHEIRYLRTLKRLNYVVFEYCSENELRISEIAKNVDEIQELNLEDKVKRI
jgi:hypothetical protein